MFALYKDLLYDNMLRSAKNNWGEEWPGIQPGSASFWTDASENSVRFPVMSAIFLSAPFSKHYHTQGPCVRVITSNLNSRGLLAKVSSDQWKSDRENSELLLREAILKLDLHNITMQMRNGALKEVSSIYLSSLSPISYVKMIKKVKSSL